MRIRAGCGVAYLGLRRERQRAGPDAGLAGRPVQRSAIRRGARRLPGGPGKLPQARAGLLPALSGEAGGLYNESRTTHGLGVSHSGGRGTWDLVLTQPLFDWSRWQRFEQSKLVVADVEV